MENALRRLAWASWSAEGGSVPLDAIDDLTALQPALASRTLLRDEAGVRFLDPDAMVVRAAEYVLEREQATLMVSPKSCFRAPGRDLGQGDREGGLRLRPRTRSAPQQPANRGFAWAREAVEAGVGVFDVLHVMEGALSHFEHAEAKTIFRFLAESYEKAKNDVFGVVLSPQLERWLPRHPEVAREIKRLHEIRPEDRGWSLYGVAVHALIHHDFQTGFELAISASASPERLIAGSALNVLGLVDYSLPERQKALERTLAVCSAIVKDPEHPLLSTAVTTASRLVHLKEPEVTVLLEEAANTHKPEALYALSGFFFRERKDFWDPPWFWPLVMHLATGDAAHKARWTTWTMCSTVG